MTRPNAVEPAHGTRQRYQLRRDPCRRPECGCRAANARYAASRRRGWVQLTIPVDAYETIGPPSAPSDHTGL